jgi:hypothetical protein
MVGVLQVCSSGLLPSVLLQLEALLDEGRKRLVLLTRTSLLAGNAQQLV